MVRLVVAGRIVVWVVVVYVIVGVVMKQDKVVDIDRLGVLVVDSEGLQHSGVGRPLYRSVVGRNLELVVDHSQVLVGTEVGRTVVQIVPWRIRGGIHSLDEL